MNNTQNPNPEIIRSINLGQLVDIIPRSGSIPFNTQLSTQLSGNPTGTIARAIAEGDTMEKRQRECFESIIPGQK